MDIERALLRGRYMRALARVELTGVPIDTVALDLLRKNWDAVRLRLVDELAGHYGIYQQGRFRTDRFEHWLAQHGIAWPRTPTGKPRLDRDTLKGMVKIHPEVGGLKAARDIQTQVRPEKIAVGRDGRHRYLARPFATKTGRNQPSGQGYLFGLPAWLRALILPPPGHAISHNDFVAQELGTAGALSGDSAMMAAYKSPDPHLGFAIQVGAAPQGATKETHGDVRRRFKAVNLGVLFGMGPTGLAARIGCTTEEAEHLLSLHRKNYSTFWSWIEGVVNQALFSGEITTVFGWRHKVGTNANPRSLMNFPMQANAAEMLRIATILATERGVKVCALVHDSIVVEAPIDEIDKATGTTRQALEEASEIVLGGFRLRVDVEIAHHPHRFPGGGGDMWRRVWRIIEELEGQIPPGILD